MTKTNIAKIVVRSIVGISTSATVSQALRNNCSPQTKIQKIEVAVGSAAVGAVASEATGRYTDRLIDDISSAFTKAKASA